MNQLPLFTVGIGYAPCYGVVRMAQLWKDSRRFSDEAEGNHLHHSETMSSYASESSMMCRIIMA